MKKSVLAAFAAAAGLALSASHANATVFQLDSISVNAHTVDSNGLQVQIIDHVAAAGGYTIDLGATDPQTLDLFTIYTPESSVNLGEDTADLPISLTFNFSSPGPNAVDPITGETSGNMGFGLLFGFIPAFTNYGSLDWTTGTASFTWGPAAPNNGLMTITVNGGQFNYGFYGLDNGPGKGLLVRATFDWDNDPQAVPEPAAWALMIGGFGLAGTALRRRRAVVA